MIEWFYLMQGSVFSAIGRGINAVISAIASVIMAIVGAITAVRLFSSYSMTTNPSRRNTLGYCRHL
jgi:hypothetical protein